MVDYNSNRAIIAANVPSNEALLVDPAATKGDGAGGTVPPVGSGCPEAVPVPAGATVPGTMYSGAVRLEPGATGVANVTVTVSGAALVDEAWLVEEATELEPSPPLLTPLQRKAREVNSTSARHTPSNLPALSLGLCTPSVRGRRSWQSVNS